MAIFLPKDEYVQMSMPKAMNRTNPTPLDASAVWTSLEDLRNYAATNPVAYVGQILSLVAYDTETEAITEVKAYIIKDAEGNIEEVGSATLGDDKSITLDNGVLSLKNWNKKYFKRDPEKEGEYIEVTVDASNPWQAGLQPRAYFDGNNYVLAWYEPSTQTIEGVDAAVGALTTTVQGITNVIGDKETAAEGTVYGDLKTATEAAAAADEKAQAAQDALAGYLPLVGGTMTGAITLTDGSTAASKAYVTAEIVKKINEANHLKRKIVYSLPEIEQAEENVIYMVQSHISITGNEYDEYLLIFGKWELIGSTAVDLTPYAKKVENAVEGNLVKLAADGSYANAGFLAQDVADHMANTDKHITADERTAWTEGAALAAENAAAIEAMPAISQDNADKLAALPDIKSIGANLVLGEDGALSAVAEQYELPAATADAIGGVKVVGVAESGLVLAGDGALVIGVSATANGLKKNADGLGLELANADNAGAMSAAMFNKLNAIAEGAEVNTIEGILLDGIAATIENEQVLIPTATTALAGLVYSTDVDNGVAVAEDGTMSVNRIDVAKLFVAEDDELILDGGKAF